VQPSATKVSEEDCTHTAYRGRVVEPLP